MSQDTYRNISRPNSSKRSTTNWLCITAAAVAGAFALSIAHADANSFSSTSFIQPPDLVASQGFGGAVAADGNTFVAATQFAPFAVYVYTNNNGTWTEQAKLTSPTGNPRDRFGSSLAIQGNTLVVGAAGALSAYVFTNVNGAWIEQQVLTPSGGSGLSFAGNSFNGMSLNGNTLAIGAGSEATPAGNTGSVYVFVNSNGQWIQQQRIVPTDSSVAGFGGSVSVQNDNLLVGAPDTAFETGAAFLFARQSGVWSQQVRFDPMDDEPEQGLFGELVSLDGNTAVIGEPEASEALIFVSNNSNNTNTWSLQAKLEGPDDSDFGTGIKVIGDLLLVTAYEDFNPAGVGTGDAFVFTRGGSTWTQQANLYMAPGFDGIPGPGEVRQRFGNLATMTKDGSRTVFILGSPTFSNPDAPQIGAVYTAILN
ncbi:MAG TPA: FG-GAP repeat protein [Verrucomicrobiae bacterium]|nr:FG-GAP repeat protein [Verrucomicrobiae bacterium]